MKQFLLPVALGLLFFAACTEFEEPTTQSDETKPRTRSSSYQSNPEDPYLLSNVQAAWNIVAAEEGLTPFELQPTHHYVRFMPQENLRV